MKGTIKRIILYDIRRNLMAKTLIFDAALTRKYKQIASMQGKKVMSHGAYRAKRSQTHLLFSELSEQRLLLYLAKTRDSSLKCTELR